MFLKIDWLVFALIIWSNVHVFIPAPVVNMNGRTAVMIKEGFSISVNNPHASTVILHFTQQPVF